MKEVTLKKAPPLIGEINVPGDKSISHRAVIFASIAEGESRVKNFLMGEDCVSSLNAMRLMGVEAEINGSSITIKGTGLRGLREPEDIIDAGNSGTTIRLLSGLLAGQDFFSIITGDRYLRKRPMKRVVDPLGLMGAEIWGREGGDKPPLAIQGTRLKGVEYSSPIASAQVKSSVLLAGLMAEGRTTVYEPSISRDHTERMLAFMGGDCGKCGDRGFYVEGGHSLSALDIDVPGDISSAAFFMVAALIVEGSRLRINRVGINPTRTGVIDVLISMGGDIQIQNEGSVAGEPVGDVLVKSSSLKGVEIGGEIIPRLIDEIPVIAVAAALAEGTTRITGAGELRVKESDRISSIADELAKFGVNVEELEDGMVIEGKEALEGGRIDSHGDHRIAMSMAVAGLVAKGETVIDGAESIEISFPGFFEILDGVCR